MLNRHQLTWLNPQNDSENGCAWLCDLNGTSRGERLNSDGAELLKINMGHVADALCAAGCAVLFKRLIPGLARRHVFSAICMAKPSGLLDQPGM